MKQEYFPGAISTEIQEKLNVYLDMVEAWNKSLNLTSYKNKADFLKYLVVDSFYLANFLSKIYCHAKDDLNICDLGAGAGLPGIPLRMIWQKGYYYLIEARQKRALFLSNVLARLKLPETAVFRGRVEDFFNSHNSSDCILGRAFMPWQKFLPFCAPYLSKNGILILLANEPSPALPAGWRFMDQYQYAVEERQRWFWALEKIDNPGDP